LSKQPDQEITSDDIDEVYRRMSRLYGHSFVSSFGTSDDGTWLMALSGLKKSDLSRGLTMLLNCSTDWPPSVPRFRRMCLGITDKHIEARAIELASGSDNYNFYKLPEKDIYFRVKEKRDQASEELTTEFLKLASNGLLRSELEKRPKLTYNEPYYGNVL